MNAASEKTNFEDLKPSLALDTLLELCKWLRKTIKALKTSFKEPGDIDKIEPKSLDAFIGTLLVYMGERSIYHKDGVSNYVQQHCIKIMTHLLERDSGNLTKVLKDYDWLLLDDYVQNLCNNLRLHVTSSVEEVTFRASCTALADLCKITGVKERLCSFLERQHGSKDSLKTILRRSLNTNKEKEPTECLFKALGLLDHFQAENEANETSDIQEAYRVVMKHQRTLLEEEGLEESKQQRGQKTIDALEVSYKALEEKHATLLKRARPDAP